MNADRKRHEEKRVTQTTPQREQRLKANRDLQEKKRAEEKTPQRQQRMNADQKRHEQKRVTQTTPQREQRLKANRELQTPFCVKLRYLFRKDKQQRLVSGNRTITVTNIFYPV